MAKNPKSKLKAVYKSPKNLDTYYEVVWDDAVVDEGGWSQTTEDQKTHEVRSVGWILKKSKSGIVLAADVSNDEIEDIEHNRRIVIPQGFIKKITKRKFGG